MRRSGGPAVRRSIFAVAIALLVASSLRAQDSLTARPPDRPTDTTQYAAPSARYAAPVASDSLRRPTTPIGAMFRSFLIPGWGQAVYGRRVTAGVMMGFEGLSLGMLLKVKSELNQIEETGSGRWRAKRQEQQDWFTVLIFNHLMSGLDAYVSSHLYDFPGDLELQALPSGGMRFGVTLPLGPR
ncbi:MAG: hypothetical protein ABJB33_10425 [Gemmatimonadota bacterium]